MPQKLKITSKLNMTQQTTFHFQRFKIYFLVPLFFLSACHLTKKNTVKKQLSENDRVQLTYLFYNANKEKILGNNEQALNLFAQCVQIDGGNDAAMYELGRIYQKQGKYDNALFFFKGAATINPDNIWYQLALVDILQKNNLYAEAITIYERLLKKYPDRVDYFSGLATTYLYAGKITEAIKVYDKLEEQIGINQEVSAQKERLYVKLGKIDKAVNEVQKLIHAFPNEVQYYGMLAELYQANGMNSKALEIYKKIQQIDPENPAIHLSLAEYYRSTGNKEKSFEELRIAFANKQLDFDTKVNILSSYYSLLIKYPELKEQAIELIKILIQTHAEESRAYAVYGDFLQQDKKYEEARTQYRKALQLSKENFLVWQQLLLVESNLNDYIAMLSESEEALTLFPTQATAYFFNGIAKLQNKQYEQAVAALNQGIKFIADNNSLLTQFYANLGDAQNKLKNFKESDTAYEKALEIDSKNTYILNNYSYYLSLRNDSLNKAEKMSLLSNELEPDNSSFQDTYGWILYRAGKYNEAKFWLEKALKSGGDTHAVIIEHYGDVLYKLGEKAKAVEYWQKAKATGTGSELLEQKISEKRLIE